MPKGNGYGYVQPYNGGGGYSGYSSSSRAVVRTDQGTSSMSFRGNMSAARTAVQVANNVRGPADIVCSKETRSANGNITRTQTAIRKY